MFGNQPIIQTRIIPPRRRNNLVARKRLIQLLDEQLEKRLVLVSAPAGYGKTSLLVDFVHQSRLPVCWYSIDRLDFDPLRFITYLGASIKQKFPDFGKRTEAVLSSDQGKFDGEYIATVMINDIYEHVKEHFLIIMDDYHLVNDGFEIQKFMSRMFMDLDENCHFLISSRTLLSLPDLPMLVARSEVGGLSYEELEFVPEEIQELYKRNQQVNISFEEAVEIQMQTEGWITGIVLTGQVTEKDSSEKSRLNRVSGISIEDYFSQVINHLSVDLQNFLLWSSLLEEFNSESCAAIIGSVIPMEKPPWNEWINLIQQNNLFAMSVGEKGDWLRYHPLFLEFLQNRMHLEQAKLAESIKKNLAKYLINKGEWDQAFSIYRNLNSLDGQVTIIQEFGLEMILNGRISTVSAWLDSLPIEILNTYPYIVALQGNIAMVSGDTKLALSLFNRAIEQMDPSQGELQLINTLLMRSAAYRVMGKLDEARKDANEILSIVERTNTNKKKKGEALRVIGLCDFQKGKLKEGLHYLESALEIMNSIQDRKNVAVIQLEIGLIQENIGNYELSKKNYLAVLNYWKSIENPFWLSNILNNLGVLYQMMGDYKEASYSFDQALKFSRSCGYTRMEAYILTGIGDVFSEIHEDDQAIQAYIAAEEIADRTQELFLQIYIKVQRASLAAYNGEFLKGKKILGLARDLIKSDASEMERNLIELEFSSLKIQENFSEEVILSLNQVCEFFKSSGNKIQFDRSNFFLLIAYIKTAQHEKIMETILHLLSSLQGDYLPVSLIAVGSRFRSILKFYSPNFLKCEYDQFVEKIDEFIAKLPALRHEIRTTSTSVEFFPPTIKIRSLGRMEVSLQNHVVPNSSWQTQAAKEMFFLLLAHPEGLTKEEISLVFWPDASYDESKFRFKNTVYRLRRALRKECVILDQNVYRFNNKIDYEYDVEFFLKENAIANQVAEPVNKLSHYREALKYYRGDYLSGIDSTWAISPREYLRQIYLNILLQVSTIYFNQSNFELAMDYCQRALSEDNLLEDAHRLAMRIYAAMGNRAGLVQQYQRCVEVLEREINATPSPKTLELFLNLNK